MEGVVRAGVGFYFLVHFTIITIIPIITIITIITIIPPQEYFFQIPAELPSTIVCLYILDDIFS